MNFLLSFFAVASISLSMSSMAHAATRDEQTQACRGDALRLCSSEIPNEDKITACMKQHVNELTPGCKAMFKPSKTSSKVAAKQAEKPGAASASD